MAAFLVLVASPRSAAMRAGDKIIQQPARNPMDPAVSPKLNVCVAGFFQTAATLLSSAAASMPLLA
jgi:hypothetical protein